MTPVPIKRRISFCMFKAKQIKVHVSVMNHTILPSELKPCSRKYSSRPLKASTLTWSILAKSLFNVNEPSYIRIKCKKQIGNEFWKWYYLELKFDEFFNHCSCRLNIFHFNEKWSTSRLTWIRIELQYISQITTRYKLPNEVVSSPEKLRVTAVIWPSSWEKIEKVKNRTMKRWHNTY